MIRVVIAVVLTTAILGTALPAIDEARRDHSETAVQTELHRIEQAARRLLETDDPTEDGARRTIPLSLPTKSWTDAGIDGVTVASAPNGSGGRLTWTVEGSTQRIDYLPAVPLRTPDGKPLSLTSAGRHRLVLSLDGTRTDPVVTVRRFTSDERTSPAHARMVTDARRGTGR